MTKSPMQYALQIVVVLLVAFLYLLSTLLFLLFFIPIIVYVVWYLYDKNKDLERRISQIEKPGEKPQEQ